MRRIQGETHSSEAVGAERCVPEKRPNQKPCASSVMRGFHRRVISSRVFRVARALQPQRREREVGVRFTAGTQVIVSRGPRLRSANKTPEPTPGPVTSRADWVSEMISSRKARLAPGPVVAHL